MFAIGVVSDVKSAIQKKKKKKKIPDCRNRSKSLQKSRRNREEINKGIHDGVLSWLGGHINKTMVEVSQLYGSKPSISVSMR